MLKPSQISSILVVAYIAVVIGGIFVQFASTGELYNLRYSLTLPSTLIVTAVGAIVAFGLWHSNAWAWWLGLTAVSVQLYRFSPWFIERLINGQVPVASGLIAILLVAFAVMHLTPAVRKSCVQ